MATWKVNGFDDYIARLERLTGDAREYIGAAIYAGAGAVADSIKAEIYRLPVEHRYVKDDQKLTGITAPQKAGLIDGMGITRMRRSDGVYNVKVGFAGYNGQKTHQYPGGQPNSVIARSVCSGTSFRRSNDFVSRGTVRAEREAIELMQESLDKFFEQGF